MKATLCYTPAEEAAAGVGAGAGQPRPRARGRGAGGPAPAGHGEEVSEGWYNDVEAVTAR